MKLKLIGLITSIIFFASLIYFNVEKNKNSKEGKKTSIQINDRIKKMSLMQKIGQMTQINLDLISKGKIYDLKKPHEIDSLKLETAINKYFIGSILNAAGYPFTRNHWGKIITQIQNKATKEGVKIPVIYGIDAVHGANYTVNSTLFPQQIGLAATWNPILVEEVAEITAYEVAASGIYWNFSPVLDIGRQPLWGRFYETFGEDVLLCKTMGKAFVRGYQGKNTNKVAACLKHFVGYSFPLSGKDRTPAWIPERILREYFIPTFEAAIEEGALTIMVNSGEVNGVPVHANKKLLTGLLRNELGFKGVLLTDWEDIIKLYKDHHIAKNMKEAVLLAINAGIDMSMTPNDYTFNETLYELVNEGQISETRIDESVRRILNLKQRLGLLKNPIPDFDKFPDFASKKHVNKSLQAAQESITLVKNKKNLLPLDKGLNILLTGPGANSLNYLNGGWTHTWQGDETKYNTVGKQTIEEALKKISSKVHFIQGTTLEKNINSDKAIEEAKNNDVIIICLSEDPAAESLADINSLDFPDAQQDLVKSLNKSGKPIIIISTTGRPRTMRDIEPLSDGILIAYLPSNEGGQAIAETIFGLNNPSGKLPFTYPRYQGLNTTYDFKHTEKKDRFLGQNSSLNQHDLKFKGATSQWDFGFGMSYSKFKYSNFKLNKRKYYSSDTIKISITLENQSKIKGKEVIQVFCSDLVASIAPSVKRLRAFKKVELDPFELQTFNFSIPIKEFSFVGINNKWTLEPGKFNLQIDSLEIDFEVL